MSANSEEDVFRDVAGGASEGDGAGGLSSPAPEPQGQTSFSVTLVGGGLRPDSAWGGGGRGAGGAGGAAAGAGFRQGGAAGERECSV
jgi:hypothetical protein